MVRYTQNGAFYDAADSAGVVLIEGTCLSTDSKPTAGIAGGSVMTEIDTGDVYFFNEAGGAWVKQFSLR